MPVNNYPEIRYKVLDKCLGNHNRKFFIEDLLNACNRALEPYEISVSERTIRDDINAIEEMNHIFISRLRDGGHKVYYRYEEPGFSIYRKILSTEEVDRLREAIAMLGKLKGLPNFEWIEECVTHIEDQCLSNVYTTSESVVSFQQNDQLKGLKHFTPLFQAIVKRQPLSILYEPFGQLYEEWTIHPYYLKQFNNRWYLLGFNPAKNGLTHIGLDRIARIREVTGKYIDKPKDFDFERDYFNEIYGVTMPKNQPIWTVKLQFDEKRWPYIESKPIHVSQKVIGERSIQIDVRPNKDLDALLLSYGDQCKILEPKWLQSSIKAKFEAAVKIYDNNEEKLQG